MKRKPVSFETAVKLAQALPGVKQSTYWGSPALMAGKKMLAVIPTNKAAEPGSLAISMDFERRAELLEAAPEVYYVKPHYDASPVVLVRLGRIDEDSLRDLLKGALRFVAGQASRGRRK